MEESQDKGLQSASEHIFSVPRHGSELETARPSTLRAEEVSKDKGCQPQSKRNPSIPRHGAALVTARPSTWRVWCGAGNGTHTEGGSAPPSPPTENDPSRTWRAAGTPVGSLLQRGSPSPPPKRTKKTGEDGETEEDQTKAEEGARDEEEQDRVDKKKNAISSSRSSARSSTKPKVAKRAKTVWQKGHRKKQGQAEAEEVQDYQKDSRSKPEGTGNYNNKGKKEDHRDANNSTTTAASKTSGTRTAPTTSNTTTKRLSGARPKGTAATTTSSTRTSTTNVRAV